MKKASSNWGHVLDVEPGDATPAEAPGWARRRRQAGFKWPTIYCNASTWPSVIQAFKDQNEPMPLWWIAKYDDVANFLTLQGMTCIAKQYHGNDPRNYDLSHVADFWPGVDGDVNMALTEDDLNKIHTKVWYTWIWSQNNGATGQNASTILSFLNDANKAMATAINGLKDIVVASDANDVTEQGVADRVKAAISADVLDAVAQALQDIEVHADVDQDALSQALISQLLTRLAS